jgi:3-hydroxy-3-methylglutaryl CoA synthase
MIDMPDKTPEQEKEYYGGNKTKLEIPQTHFEDPSGEWFLVCDGKNIPEKNQEILYVFDIRGTQSEHVNDFMKRTRPDQEVRHGYVDEVGYNECMKQWHITTRSNKNSRNLSHLESADHITYWRPLPQPPTDTFKRHAFSYYEVFDILLAKEIRANHD